MSPTLNFALEFQEGWGGSDALPLPTTSRHFWLTLPRGEGSILRSLT